MKRKILGLAVVGLSTAALVFGSGGSSSPTKKKATPSGYGEGDASSVDGLVLIDRTAFSPTEKRIRSRKVEGKVDSVVLHQMGFSRGSDPTRYDKVTAHYAVLPDGTVVQLHPIESHLWASNGFNNVSVSIEFAGNLPNDGECTPSDPCPPSKWWKGDKFGRDYLTPEQALAGRRLLAHIHNMLEARGSRVRYLYGHIQSHGGKPNDPSARIWRTVAEPMCAERGWCRRDWTLGGGKPIPESWRVVA